MQDKERRKSEAERLMGEPLLMEAFQVLENETVEELVNAKLLEDAQRRALADRIRTIRDVKQRLKSVIQTGKVYDGPNVA